MKPMTLAIVVLAGCAGTAPSGGAVDELIANDDMVTVEMNTATDIDVLANDVGYDDAPTLALVAAPTTGSAELVDGVVRYTPMAEFLGDDELRYSITNADGTTGEALVQLEVGCATCALASPIELRWDANPPEQGVTGYRIYFGHSDDTAMMTMADDLAIGDPGFDPSVPGRIFDAWTDFKLRWGDLACFALTAYNTAGESPFTVPVCKTIVKDSMMPFVL